MALTSYESLLGNRYRLDEQIGSGGMGEVFRALDQQTGDVVAIKRLKPTTRDTATEMIARFMREAEALRQLNHPNIVHVYDQFKDDGSYYFVMEYINGGSLDQVLSESRQSGNMLPISQITAMALDIADALTRAHHLRIVHRDLKPANILCADDGSIRLSDFGIAWFESVGDKRFTESGNIVGTVDYISPEMLNGDTVDHRTDIWAFGILLFELLTLQRPFHAANMAGVMKAILVQSLPDLEALRSDIPIALVDLVYRLLEKDPLRRIPSMRLVGASLEAILAGQNGDHSPHPTTRLSVTDIPTFEPTPPTGIVRHNLPLSVTPFVGRANEVQEIQALLLAPDTRLLTIMAPGGMGKTRLALEVARQMVDNMPSPFTDGVYFVELAALSSPESLVSAIADAIGFTLEANSLSYRHQIVNRLRNKQTLLIFDNFEHLMEGASVISDLLVQAPSLKILVTSRERLNLQNEMVYRLAGMDFAEEDAQTTSAVQLFVQSASYAQPGFKLQPDNVRDIVTICNLVDGLPLGIVLAAGWVGMLTTAEIVSEIQRTLDFLESSARDLPDRHHSVRAVFDYSWRLMNSLERDALMQLAIFRGGFTREAAQAVTRTSLQILLSLVNKSLLNRDPASGRYQCHSLMRQYAEEALERAGSTQIARDAHCEYFLDLMYQHRIDLSGKKSQTFDQFEADMENIRIAWSYAIDTKRYAAIQRAMSGLVGN